MKISVLQFPGTNCEYDTKYAFEQLGCDVEIIWHKNKEIPTDTDLVVIPGGFSYGDYLRSGAIARFANIMESVKEYASKGGKVLGICNGFQILLEAGLLPGAMKRNDSLHFISKFHTLKVINNDNLFLGLTKKDEVLNIPVAHHDGNYYIDNEGLKELEANGQILLKYCDKDGNLVNMNGSVSNIAGICNKEKNVFGLMPHPERAIEELLGSIDGINMLKGFLQ
ncbi:phosphoribosylformylglycinamidine synthase I [Arcobacter cloacae]|uniref:Phosphoribosylformylglycinamidine synthase subunit PurQ n=1 Tax=Arcobacter cloacae TaxID=1054034 RepID=A0A4Q0ZDK7_9BACT|nr:phosphoribosylformylglycinamidine synthase I [Arcobacter cloacae]RXJ84467.1 phosphoribosylformylglycinamidine synthase I [Arcobacter cloacae]